MSSLFAYGSGYSSHFEPVTFFTKPQVILRFLSIIFAIVVFGCISAGSYDSNGICLFASNTSACGYGTAIGVIAFLICLAFLVTDALFESISNVNHRKIIVISDMAVSGVWTAMWFIGFCFITNQWAWTDQVRLDAQGIPAWQLNNCRGAIAFCFFSILSWGLICFFAVRNYMSGGSNTFLSGPEIQQQNNSSSMPDSFSYPGVDIKQPEMGGVGGSSGNRSEYYAAPFTGATPAYGSSNGAEFQEPRY